MHIEVEPLLDQPRKRASPDRLAGNKLGLEKRQDLVVELVGTARASLLGHQPCDAGFFEARPGLVIGRPRDPVFLSRIRHRRVLDGDPAQHLVLDLDEIARIEKLAFPELRIADLLRCRVQSALCGEGISLRALRIVLCRHCKLRDIDTERRNGIYDAYDIPVKAGPLGSFA
jgi:hypothetical protein